MRDVAVVSFCAVGGRARRRAQRGRDARRRRCTRRSTESGIPKNDIGFVCSGSLDYLQGGPFAFVAGLDAVGAWPPMRESHVEMDAAWALYEAWVAIQTGEVDSALVYGFGKSSPGDLHEIMTLQTDPYYVAAAVAVDGRHGRAAGARATSTRAAATEEDLAEVAARAQRNGRANPNAVRAGDVDAPTTCWRSRSRTTRCATPTSRRSPTAPPRSCSRPATSPARCASGRRGSGAIEHRIEAHSLGVRDLTHSRVDPRPRRRGRASANGKVDVAELHAQFSHEELILAEALGLNGDTAINPSGGAARGEPGDERRA